MSTTTRTVLIIPTAINVLCAINEGIVQNRRRDVDGLIELPSTRKLAKLLTNEYGLLPVKQEIVTDTDFFTR